MAIREIIEGREYRVEVRGHKRADGTRAYKSVVIHGGIREAKDAERELLNTRDVWGADHSIAARKVKTVADYVPVFLSHKRREVESRTYIRNLERHYDRFLLPTLGAVALKGVTTSNLRDLFGAIPTMNLKDGAVPRTGTTCRGIETSVKMLFRRAYIDGLIQRDPGAGVKRTKTDTGKHHILTHAEAEAFLAHVAGTVVSLPATVLYATGMRPEELLALTWDNVDFKARTISLDKALVEIPKTDERPGHWEIGPMKTPAGYRTYHVAADLAALLRAHKKHLEDEKRRYAPDGLWEDTPLVFPATRGRMDGTEKAGRIWTYSAFSQAWGRARRSKRERDEYDWESIGSPPRPVVPYTLRHTWANHRLLEGVRMQTVSELMGHADSAITARAYRRDDEGRDGEGRRPGSRRPRRRRERHDRHRAGDRGDDPGARPT